MAINLKDITEHIHVDFDYKSKTPIETQMHIYSSVIEKLVAKAIQARFGLERKPAKKKTYASQRTRSARWRAGSKSSRPKHNWSKKKRQRWLP